VPARILKISFLFAVITLISSELFAATNQTYTLDQMRQIVQQSSSSAQVWAGPTTGPQAQAGKTIAIIGEDLRNGGIIGVAHGVQEAAQAIGWRVRVFDAGGTAQGRRKAAADALASNPDGVIVDGSDVHAVADFLQPFVDAKIPVVGWHVGPVAGAMQGPVSMNVSTDPLEVARLTAMAAIVDADGKASVVVFTDSNFEIAMAKANTMADVVRSCSGCAVLEVRDVAISESAKLMPEVTRELLDHYAGRWTHALAINDIYFDYAVPELIKAGSVADNIKLLSAGDGSTAAFLRIQSATYQTSTVAEPLNLHGWQLVDELNRLMHGQPVTGYVFPPHLITQDNMTELGGVGFSYDPNNGYRDIYQQIWKQ
jgi:ribose transport system substrate-binding protein